MRRLRLATRRDLEDLAARPAGRLHEDADFQPKVSTHPERRRVKQQPVGTRNAPPSAPVFIVSLSRKP